MSTSDVAASETNAISEMKFSDVDPWRSNGNHNVLLIGGAGSGCTVVSNNILVNHVQDGGVAWALRWGSRARC